MKVIFAWLLLVFANFALAGDVVFPGVAIDVSADEGGYSNALKVLVLLTLLSLAPAMLMMLTSFTRMIIVLAMLRHAIGMPTTPPNSVLIAFALFLTLFTMAPTIDRINERVLVPYNEKAITDSDFLDGLKSETKGFLVSQTREKDVALILSLSRKQLPDSVDDLGLSTLMPAFMLSELQTAFKIGFIIFLPFLVVDLIVASVLMSMGMIMLPPMTISLPIKILMFVLIEGWALVAQALVGSYI
ncbi:flagellar type III secretion system pore protein FliP [Ketobacter alkanivorans]|uniref:flagellar type III secretion system pore protein FliP n=1 Tax=Ketobacter alkanivorans TaxID=1917421 RepID=UPI0018F7F629|nr:flagellar type III secretion system pore protein FliP [Ketobacter alkanivorans]